MGILNDDEIATGDYKWWQSLPIIGYAMLGGGALALVVTAVVLHFLT